MVEAQAIFKNKLSEAKKKNWKTFVNEYHGKICFMDVFSYLTLFKDECGNDTMTSFLPFAQTSFR